MIIENAKLIEIDKHGTQKFSFPYVETMPKFLKPPYNQIFLAGWNKAKNIKIGDIGKLIYKTGPGYGLYFFEKY